MKNISVIVTKEDVKKNVRLFKIWTTIFILLIIFSTFIGNIAPNFTFYIVGLFLSSTYWYFNHKSLKAKGNTISKTIIDVNSIKNSLLYSKIILIFWIIFVGSFLVILTIEKSEMIMGTFFVFIFLLILLYRRIKFLSNYLIKKR